MNAKKFLREYLAAEKFPRKSKKWDDICVAVFAAVNESASLGVNQVEIVEISLDQASQTRDDKDVVLLILAVATYINSCH